MTQYDEGTEHSTQAEEDAIVAALGKRIRAVLRRNRERKRHWKHDSPQALLSRLKDEVAEVGAALADHSATPDERMDEVADAGAFLAMLLAQLAPEKPTSDVDECSLSWAWNAGSQPEMTKAVFDYAISGHGFGQVTITQIGTKTYIDSEACSRDTVKRVFELLVDGAVLESEEGYREAIPHD